MIQLVPVDIAFIQLFDGSVPMFKPVADVVVLSEIKLPEVAATATVTLAIFLIVISRPAPAADAPGEDEL